MVKSLNQDFNDLNHCVDELKIEPNPGQTKAVFYTTSRKTSNATENLFK